MDETITTPALPGTETQQGAPASGGDVAGSTTAKSDVVEVKDLLNKVLGKEFPTNEAALKSVQDTFKWGNELSQKVKTLEQELQVAATATKTTESATNLAGEVETLKAQVRNAEFFAANPQYNNPEAKALITKFGGNPEEVINDEVFKTAFTAIGKVAEVEKSKSVLHSNSRLGTVQDNMTKAVEAQKAGNHTVAADAATSAVLEAYQLQ